MSKFDLMIMKCGAWLQVGKAPGFRLIQTKPGTVAMEINVTSGNSIWKSPNGDVEIQYTQPQINNDVVLNAYFFNTGIHLLVRRYPIINWLLHDRIDFEVRVPCSYSTRTFGLLGNLDGNSTNDLYRRGNTTSLNFPGSLTEKQLREILQDSCKFGCLYPLVFKIMIFRDSTTR